MKKLKAYTINDVMKRVDRVHAEKKAYFEATGLCFNCNTDLAQYPYGLDPFKCLKCNDKTAGIIRRLQGHSGFTEVKLK